MTPEQEFLRRIYLHLQSIHIALDNGRIDLAKNTVIKLERMLHEAATSER